MAFNSPNQVHVILLEVIQEHLPLKPYFKKSVVFVKRKMDLLKRSYPCFPGFSVQRMVLVNPCLRFTKTTDC